MKALFLLPGFGGLLVALLNPLVGFGTRLWGPGYGDLLNGAVGVGLMGLSAVLAFAFRSQFKRAAVDGGRGK
jgi:hypothetical protein